MYHNLDHLYGVGKGDETEAARLASDTELIGWWVNGEFAR